jgi:hypothetical protein
MAPNTKVQPLTNGAISATSRESAVCSISAAPTRVEIATAPILIQ